MFLNTEGGPPEKSNGEFSSFFISALLMSGVDKEPISLEAIPAVSCFSKTIGLIVAERKPAGLFAFAMFNFRVDLATLSFGRAAGAVPPDNTAGAVGKVGSVGCTGTVGVSKKLSTRATT